MGVKNHISRSTPPGLKSYPLGVLKDKWFCTKGPKFDSHEEGGEGGRENKCTVDLKFVTFIPYAK